MFCASNISPELKNFKNISLIVLGTFIMSVAINAIYLPSKIISGGVTGIALLLHIITGIEPSIVIVLLNIPIFLLGYKFINKKFILSSLFGMLCLAGFLELTKNLYLPSDEMLTTILLGGVVNGVGVGLVFKSSSSCGGNDILSKIINKYFSYSIPTLNLTFNIIVIGLSIYFFDIDTAIQSLACMYVSTLVAKFILEGVAYKRTVLVVSDNKDAIVKKIDNKLNRGCTVISGTGGHTGKGHNLLYCVIAINQVAKLRSIIRECDPHAFINVIESKAVIGNGRGFYPIVDDNEMDTKKVPSAKI